MVDGRIVDDSVLILAAGMPRSASTWLYNAARLILCSVSSIERDFSCGFIDDWDQIPPQKYRLIKMHEYDPVYVEQAHRVVYSYRDIRDVMASNYRKFGFKPAMETADFLIRQHELWIGVAHYVMRYETMLEGKEDIIGQLARCLGFDEIDSATMVSQLDALRYESPGPKNENYHRINLYHRGHITDGRHGSWKEIIDQSLLDRIVEKYRNWFGNNGYPTDDT